MPNYKTHDKAGIVSTIPVTIVALSAGFNVQSTAILVVGIVVATYLLSPDLDIHSRIYRRWGLLRWIWIPYQCIPHRSWISHSGPISATLRLFYLCLWLLPLL